MPKQKTTALQDLIVYLEIEKNRTSLHSYTTALEFAISLATELLEKEKQQIMSAHDDGQNTEFISPAHYFKKTYQQ